MYYIYIQNSTVQEAIPEFVDDFPDVPVTKRYSAAFLKHCVKWDEEVPQGWLYDKATNTFNAPAEPPEVTPPSNIGEARAVKLAELSNACEGAIYAGVSAETTKGIEHFSLTLEDQTNIGNLMLQAQMGSPVLYHADGELCRWFVPDEFMKIAAAVVAHKTYNTTKCNHLNTWVRRTDDIDEISKIQYDSVLPKDLADHMNQLLSEAK